MKAAVIVADPCWRYQNFTDAVHGAAASHYDTMTYAELAALPVASFAADDCVLACWGTWPKLDEGVDLIRAWGFEFVTGFPWVKVTPSSREIYTGIGFWKQSCSEVVLIARRGEPKRIVGAREPGLGLLVGEPRIFYAPRSEHSTKPEEVQDWLAREFRGPYLELFARRERPGWACWGRETGFVLSASGVERAAKPIESLPLFDRVESVKAGTLEGLEKAVKALEAKQEATK